MKNSAAHNPSDIQPSFQGEERIGGGYAYWTTNQEDEESLNIREQVASGTVVETEKPKKKRKRLMAPGFVGRTFGRFFGLVLLLTLVAVAYIAFNYVQISDAADQRAEGPADAIVVLGDAESGDQPSIELRERLDHAFNLFDNDVAPLIITTVADDDGRTGRQYLLDRGVPSTALAQISEGQADWDQLASTMALLDERNLASALIVSDSHNNLRLRAITDEIGLNGDVSPSLRAPSFVDKAKEAIVVGIGRLSGYENLALDF